MKYDPSIHHRRSIRLKEYNYSEPGAYFITLITSRKTEVFGEIDRNQMHLNPLGEIIRTVWLQLPRFFPIWHDEWVIMPNHLHGIIWILGDRKGEASAKHEGKSSISLIADASPIQRPNGTKSGSLGAIIQNFKSVSTRKINQLLSATRKGEAFDITGSPMISTPLSNASPQPVWQRNYFERIVRNEKELNRIREYIIDNPRRWTEDEQYRE